MKSLTERLWFEVPTRRGFFARTGQRLLKHVDGRIMVGGDTLAVDLVFGDESLEACLFGRRGL